MNDKIKNILFQSGFFVFVTVAMFSCSKKMNVRGIESLSKYSTSGSFFGENGTFNITIVQYANKVVEGQIRGYIRDKDSNENLSLGNVKLGDIELNHSKNYYNSTQNNFQDTYVNRTPQEIGNLFGKNIVFKFDGNESKRIKAANQLIEMPELIHLTNALDKDYFKIDDDENIVLTWKPSSKKIISMTYSYEGKDGKSISKSIQDNGFLVIPRSEIETFGKVTIPIYLCRYSGKRFKNNGYKYLVYSSNNCRVGDFTIMSEVAIRKK